MANAPKKKTSTTPPTGNRSASDYPQFYAKDAATWRAWLEANHAKSKGVWLVTDKKSGEPGQKRLEPEAAIEEVVCFGWVDSLPRALDEKRTMVLMTPRKAKANWSQKNKDRVARLIAAGRMAPSGLAVVEAAKKSGTWDALVAVEALEVPPDLARALDERPPARTNYEAFPRTVKRGILEWIAGAKRPETRAKRVEETAVKAKDGIRAAQWRQ